MAAKQKPHDLRDDIYAPPTTVTNTDEIWTFSYDAASKVQTIECASLERHHRVYEHRVGREHEDRRATRVVWTGIADKSS